MGFTDYVAQVVGVQKEKTKEELLSEAASEYYDGTKKAGQALGKGLASAYESAADVAGQAAEYAQEKAAIGADIAAKKMAEGADVAKENILAGAAVTGEFVVDQSEKAWENTKVYSDILAKKAAQEGAEQIENMKQLASDAAQYSQEKFPEVKDATFKLAGNTIRQFKDSAGDVWERIENSAGETYDRLITPASETTDRVVDKAGNVYQYYKDASGKEGRRLINKAGELYDETAQQAQDEAHGLFHGLSHLGHSIGSVFSHGKDEAADKARDMYDASAREGQRLAQSGRQYAEEAAANVNAGYQHVKDQVQPPQPSWWQSILPGSSHKKASYFDQKAWEKYFKKNPQLNMNEWKAYFQDSNINPANWLEYMDAYQKGPRGLNAFWQKIEKQGSQAKGALQGQYVATKHNAYHTLRHGSQKYLGVGDREGASDSAAAAPVSLFWTAVLALYLLVLAKRMFEQKRLLVSHEKDGRDTPASSAAEKLRLSDVARASSDSLSNFALYAPATAVVLLTHELQNAASPYVLHGLYAALFVGQILQNEATYVSTAKARGAGIYLSWAAAGLAGAAGIMTSLTGFHL